VEIYENTSAIIDGSPSMEVEKFPPKIIGVVGRDIACDNKTLLQSSENLNGECTALLLEANTLQLFVVLNCA
jgi:hypothetical protein